MAYSYISYTGDGSTTSFAVPFPYIEESDVAVTVSGTSVAFSWVSGGLISISPAPITGSQVFIKRTTKLTDLEVTFVDGSTVTASDINTDARQALYLLQELADNMTAITQPMIDAIVAAATPTVVTEVSAALESDIGPLVTTYFHTLPTTLPATAGVLWNNGGVVSIS